MVMTVVIPTISLAVVFPEFPGDSARMCITQTGPSQDPISCYSTTPNIEVWEYMKTLAACWTWKPIHAIRTEIAKKSVTITAWSLCKRLYPTTTKMDTRPG